ncbi:MAG TPA: flagellar biosynthetic protein FliO [Candidatus Nanopelagicaceae bacterium]|nr:flagellar biosynthetic protein FliO [Candidatus Nanopelagicaceae bacterium]
MKAVYLVFQVLLSLGVVLLLMWLLAKALRGKLMARGVGVVELLARTPMTRNSAVTVIRVADRVLVLGVTETQLTVLAEVDPQQIQATASEPVNIAHQRQKVTHFLKGRAKKNGTSALAGSILAPDIWQRVITFLRERTIRR